MCKRCFDVGPQTFGAARPLLKEFCVWRDRKKAERNNNHSDVPVQPLYDVKEELQRLVEGYTKHIGNSKLKSFVLEAFSLVKIPDWQKSKYWMVSTPICTFNIFIVLISYFEQDRVQMK